MAIKPIPIIATIDAITFSNNSYRINVSISYSSKCGECPPYRIANITEHLGLIRIFSVVNDNARENNQYKAKEKG